jgi:hypothetical protein
MRRDDTGPAAVSWSRTKVRNSGLTAIARSFCR